MRILPWKILFVLLMVGCGPYDLATEEAEASGRGRWHQHHIDELLHDTATAFSSTGADIDAGASDEAPTTAFTFFHPIVDGVRYTTATSGRDWLLAEFAVIRGMVFVRYQVQWVHGDAGTADTPIAIQLPCRVNLPAVYSARIDESSYPYDPDLYAPVFGDSQDRLYVGTFSAGDPVGFLDIGYDETRRLRIDILYESTGEPTTPELLEPCRLLSSPYYSW